MAEYLCGSSATEHHASDQNSPEDWRSQWRVIQGGRAGEPASSLPPDQRPRIGYRDHRDFSRSERPSLVNRLARIQEGETWDDELGWVQFDLPSSAFADLYVAPLKQ